MPPKKGKKKKAKKIKMIGNETPDQVIWRLLRTYERNCAQSDTVTCQSLVRTLRGAKDEQKILTKFILEASPVELLSDPVVSLEPLILAFRQERYTMVSELYVWELPLDHVQLATLALLLEKGAYLIKKLELMNCLIEAHSLRRLSLSFNCVPSITTLVFDYNEFGDEGCKGLCDGLHGNKCIISISLCFCELGVASGSYLGKTLDMTAVRELYLDGNDLECEGLVELIKGCAEQAEVEHQQAIEEAERKKEEEERLKLEEQEKRSVFTPSSDQPPIETAPKGKKKKKKGKKKKSKEPPPPPPVGPWLYKLHIADNGIDYYRKDGHLAPLICMRLVRKLIAHSKCLEEIDLEDNLIGDMGGRELVEGLEERKEGHITTGSWKGRGNQCIQFVRVLYCKLLTNSKQLPAFPLEGMPNETDMGGVKMRTTHRMNSDTFNQLIKLGVGLKKKKKKGKKKKKK